MLEPSTKRRGLWAWAALVMLACATAPRPRSLQDATNVSSSDAVQASEQWAPQAYARAKGLLEQAEEAQSDGKVELASALAEHALAAYQRAQIQARVAKAEQRLATAKERLASAEQQLNILQTSQKEVAARAEALELEYKVARDAEPLAPLEGADPRREAARRVAARSIIEGGRLLCLAARLLDAKTDVSDLSAKMNELEGRLEQSPRPTPVNEATALRSACLERITRIRMKQQRKAPAKDDADVLLSRLSTAMSDTRAFRDDRGVVVPLDRAFDAKGELAQATLGKLSELAEIAKANPTFPLMLVIHGRPNYTASATENVRQWLDQHGLQKTAVFDAGDQLPATVQLTTSAADAARLEFVFVAN